jgi:hypothetical protein
MAEVAVGSQACDLHHARVHPGCEQRDPVPGGSGHLRCRRDVGVVEPAAVADRSRMQLPEPAQQRQQLFHPGRIAKPRVAMSAEPRGPPGQERGQALPAVGAVEEALDPLGLVHHAFGERQLARLIDAGQNGR